MIKKALCRSLAIFFLAASTCSTTVMAMPTVDKNGEGALMELEKVPFYEYKSALSISSAQDLDNQFIWITDELKLPDATMADGMQVFVDPFNTGFYDSIYVIRKLELPTAQSPTKDYRYTLEVYSMDYPHGG